MSKISATIITFNEEKHIARCIESLRDIADEIIVVDSFSNDSTTEICEAMGCKVTRRKMKGYGAQRQYATSLTCHNYVLSIDADEVLSPALRASLIKLKNGDFNHRGYSFSRLNFYCGTPVKHCGWYPDIQVRLFDKRYANWNLHDVDESVIFRDNVMPVKLDGDILHYRCTTEDEFQQTERAHAALLAKSILETGKTPGVLTPYIQGIKSFIQCYIAQGGALDGLVGTAISKQKYHSTLLAWSTARKKSKNNK